MHREASERLMGSSADVTQAPLMAKAQDHAGRIRKELARLAEEAEEAGFHMLAYLIQMAEIEAKTEEAKEQRQ